MTQKLNKSNEIADWIVAINKQQPKSIDPSSIDRINVSASASEEVLAIECEEIEKRAESGKTYFYNTEWDEKSISHLREYAMASGMDMKKFQGHDASQFREVKAKEEKEMLRTASVVAEKQDKLMDALVSTWKDPFAIDEKLKMREAATANRNWEEVSISSYLSDKPSFSGIKAIRGGESYNKNVLSETAKNQNSIVCPNKIEEMVNSQEEDTGIRLRNERLATEARRRAEVMKERDEKASIAEADLKIISTGCVFPTESLVAQPGLRQGSGGQSTFDPDNIPELTEGEKLIIANKERKQSIQRESKQQDDDWQQVKTSTRQMSDVFSQELARLTGVK